MKRGGRGEGGRKEVEVKRGGEERRGTGGKEGGGRVPYGQPFFLPEADE